MNIFQINCFLAVAENLSFARAAEQLHVTQPAVTQQIHALEKELNARLFTRTTRAVRLTEEGKSFFNDARQMSEIYERAVKRFEHAAYGEIQTLSIGCYNYPCLFLLTGALGKLAAAFPNFHPRLQVVPFLRIYRMLEEGGLDAVVSFRESDSMKISAAYEELGKVPVVCVCRKDHPLARLGRVTADDLRSEKLVMFTPSRTSPLIAQTQGALMGGRAPSEFYFCDSGEAIVVLVDAGFGVSVLPDLSLPKTLEITSVPFEDAEPLSFGVYHRAAHGGELLDAFLRELKEDIFKETRRRI
ncbi:LysR family transcriptional regulator [Cloacibacillus sp. An23]|uniref:LysR family transcriptional regulator n=1 Tax=Cloacibacillus sp. An23 TaxID=1965591 RepID=UPI000B3AB4CF|nr:LysR family transcriptional regulator [Cloacibacillus sp. An23]OUO94855.1 hypothetical protein B5F39_03035 [Cloacibacillus sp. An23]